jgi:ubiquinone/menaquinone biosynthesis C-methylase UbiE
MADQQSFFTDGDAYEKFMGRWSRATGELFLDWLALPPGLRWLDVGCGTGAFTELILKRCAPAQVSAIDPAPDQIATARKGPAGARVDFQVGDALALPFAPKGFDAAAMALVISFLPDPAKGVSEMARVLKPGGTAAAYMWDFLGKGFTQYPMIEAMATMGVTVPTMPGYAITPLDKLQGLFTQAGFDRVEGRPIDIEVSYADFDDYWSSQTALPTPTVQSIRKMPASDVERLKAYLREHLPTKNGRIAYPARANAVKGVAPG